jgi:hypothetical protein
MQNRTEKDKRLRKAQLNIYLDAPQIEFLQAKADAGYKLSSYIRFLIKKAMADEKRR